MTPRTLAVQRFGEGAEPVLLLHGFLGSSRNLTALARRLAAVDAGLAVHAVDLTGHGASPPLPPGADLETLAEDVLETARAIGLKAPLRIVGHSLGGRVALCAGRMAPRRLGQVVLLDIGPDAIRSGATETTRVVELLLAAPPAAGGREVFREHFRAGGLADPVVDWLLLNLVRDGDAYRWGIDRPPLAALHGTGNAEDLWDVVEGPRGWTLRCIRGALSPYVSDAAVRRLVAAGCPVETIQGAGHFLHVDRPAEVLAALRSALRVRRTP